MIETLKHLLSPDWIIQHGGLFLLLFIIFAETGLLIGFFLPGDSLLFVAGIYVQKFATEFGNQFFPIHYLFIMLLIAIAGILGNIVGYWFGKKSGPFLYERNDSFLFKKKHLNTAREFYEKNGNQAIILGRFLPIVRTFAPIVAGIVQMNWKRFMFNNIIGSMAWVFSMMLAGKFLHKFFLDKYNFDLTKRLEIIVIGIILVTTLPVIYKFVFAKNKNENS